MGKDKLIIRGAREHNLKNINVKIPLGKFICVTGVSGSGKSTLVNEILGKTLMSTIYKSKEKPGEYKTIKGLEHVDKVINITQDPIGRTPRSNPATYVGVFDDIRDVFANTKEAKIRGYDKGRFSFNVKGGRCEACWGDGVKKIEMHFLPDVYIPCEVCHGTRYNSETLNIKYKGKNIAEVLDMRVTEALQFFENVPKIKRKLQKLLKKHYLRLSKNLKQSTICKSQSCFILRPPTVTLKISGLSLAPLQSGHGHSVMRDSISLREYSLEVSLNLRSRLLITTSKAAENLPLFHSNWRSNSILWSPVP